MHSTLLLKPRIWNNIEIVTGWIRMLLNHDQVQDFLKGSIVKNASLVIALLLWGRWYGRSLASYPRVFKRIPVAYFVICKRTLSYPWRNHVLNYSYPCPKSNCRGWRGITGRANWVYFQRNTRSWASVEQLRTIKASASSSAVAAHHKLKYERNTLVVTGFYPNDCIWNHERYRCAQMCSNIRSLL